MCAHTHSSARENPHIIGGGGCSLTLLFFFLSLFISLRPFLKSCNTGKICKPWSGNSGFSQWEHSVIPAGRGHRVNTFFSQARNSLAGERAAEKEGGRRGGETEKEKDQSGEREYNKGYNGQKKKPFLVVLFLFLHIFFFLVKCSHCWPCNLLPPILTHTQTHSPVMSLKQIRPMAALHRGHVKSADCLNHISPALASV